ncbi:MAG: hypothetical protein KDI01_03905 [Halioglobus sp.]|nr:hypothetical protein [Halioglobus sp.]
MNITQKLVLPATLALGLVTVPVAYGLDSAMLSDPIYEALPPGEFVLGNGDDKTIVNAKTDKTYRICAGRGSKYERKDQIPVKVVHDGKTTMVNPGDCADVEGKEITVKPGGKLEEDFILDGKFHRLK